MRCRRWLWRLQRVHHSIAANAVNAANANFGFTLTLWERICGTYPDQPHGGHTGMTLGTDAPRDPRQVSRLPGMLLLSLRGAVTDCAINRRAWKTPEDAA